jgi:Zn-dependent M28 family amino/carboxypeptidase
VLAGPGINDNGSGSSALLEIAQQISKLKPENTIRFAWWGAEESGLLGSRAWVDEQLVEGTLGDVALYLNFDSIGSPNAGFFTYDGDQSGQPNPDLPASRVPPGSAGIERTLAGYLNLAGVRPADMPLSRASDYSPFLTAGVPIGGITTGASQRKTEVQARLWGGQAGAPFDPGFHSPRDTIDNVDRHALSITGPAVAFAVGTYAQSTDGVNGVPTRG